MTELFIMCPECSIVCPICWGKPPFHIRTSEADVSLFGANTSCHYCQDQRYVRLTPQNCQGHEWVVRVIPLAGYWKVPRDPKQRTRTQARRTCRFCGVRASEVTP